MTTPPGLTPPSPSPAGGTWTPAGGNPIDDAYLNGGGYGMNQQGGSFSCDGAITTTYKWSDPNNPSDPPPQNVLVTETGNIAWHAVGPNDPMGSCSNSIGGKPVPDSNTTNLPPGWTYNSDSISGTNYTVVTGGPSSFTTTGVTMTGSVPSSDNSGLSAIYSVAISPITIDPVGATPDGKGGYDILIGQLCQPELQGFPTSDGTPNTSGWSATYKWDATGPTFQSWKVSNDQSYTSYLDGLGPLNGPNPTANPPIPAPSWYWHNGGNNQNVQENITCSATVTPPSGQGNPFAINITQVVNVYVPKWKCTGYGGMMQINTNIPNGNGSDEWLWAGPLPAGTPNLPSTATKVGMDWEGTVTSPLVGVFANGSLSLAQLITPDAIYNSPNNLKQSITYNWSLNNQQGLDGPYPYGYLTTGPNYAANDSPGINLTLLAATAATESPQFEDYLLFWAPGSVQPVPLAHFIWGTNSDVTIPNGGWAKFGSGSAGTVTPSGTLSPFQQDNLFPTWSQNDIVSNGNYVPQ